jgi:hypothetical protein
VTNPARRTRRILVAALMVGLAFRAAAVWVAPRLGYLNDHRDFMAWATWAATHGATTIYDMQPELVPLRLVAIDPNTRQPANYMVFAPHAFNYPPFSAWMFWLKGVLLRVLDGAAPTIPVPPALRASFERAGLPPAVEFRTIGTRLTWAIDALPSFAFDVALALGVMALVRVLRGARPADAAAAAGFALVFVSPAVFLDGAFWGQSDSWISSMLVWCLVWWLRERWILAGAAYGLALVTKPQAILFAPLLAFAFVALRLRPGGSWGGAARALRAVPAAAVVVLAIAAPFMVHDARSGAGAWRWLERSWLGTIGSDEYAYTTLNAFNLWWLDLVAQRPTSDDWWRLLDSRLPSLLGPSKDATGALLLGLALVAGAAACARRLRWGAASCVTFAFLVLLSAFLLPTRVHERYVYYCIPFVTALAADRRAWWPILGVITVVGTAEMVSHLFVSAAPGSLAATGITALAAVSMLPWSLLVATRERDADGETRPAASTP